MCTELHFHLLFPPGKPAAALLRGWLCMWQVSLGPQQAGWFLPSSFWVSLLPPSCLSQGRVPGLWDGKQEPRSGRSRHGQIAVLSLSFPWKSPESMVELGKPATCLQALPTPPRLLEDSGTSDWLHPWSGQVCPCTWMSLEEGA